MDIKGRKKIPVLKKEITQKPILTLQGFKKPFQGNVMQVEHK